MKEMKDFNEIVQYVIENGRVDSQASLEVEFEVEAAERGWAPEEIAEWFPFISGLRMEIYQTDVELLEELDHLRGLRRDRH